MIEITEEQIEAVLEEIYEDMRESHYDMWITIELSIKTFPEQKKFIYPYVAFWIAKNRNYKDLGMVASLCLQCAVEYENEVMLGAIVSSGLVHRVPILNLAETLTNPTMLKALLENGSFEVKEAVKHNIHTPIEVMQTALGGNEVRLH